MIGNLNKKRGCNSDGQQRGESWLAHLRSKGIPVASSHDLPYTWKRAGRGWGHSLHKLSQYIGAYPPSLARYFIAQLSDEGNRVFDPFSGGGTTILEAILAGRNGIASDSFYYGYILSRAKAQPLDLQNFDSFLSSKIRESHLVQIDRRDLDDAALRASYSEKTLEGLLRFRSVLADDDGRAAIFTKGLVCGILHGPSKMFLSLPQKDTVSSSPEYVRKYAKEHKLAPPDRDLYECAMNKARRSLREPLPGIDGEVFLSDSRELMFLADESVDLILTSPPYLSVLDYSWNNWLRLWWLGKDRANERTKLLLTSDETKYRRFMRESLAEMFRVLKRDSAAVIVVGDVKRARRTGEEIINSALLIWEEARHVGFEVQTLINDNYALHNRSMLVYNSLKWGYDSTDHEEKSSVLIDRCLVLRKGKVRWRKRPLEWYSRNGQVNLDL